MTNAFVCEKCGTPVTNDRSPLARVKRCAACARKSAAAELEAAVRFSRFRREAMHRLELFQTEAERAEKAAPARAERSETAASVAALRGTISRVLARSLASN